MSSTWRPVTGEFRIAPIVPKFPGWLKDACTAFFISAEYPLRSVHANNNLYVLLADIAQEVRTTEKDHVDVRCIPYRAELKQRLREARLDRSGIEKYPDWLVYACSAFFVVSDVLARSAPFDDAVFLTPDVAYKELSEHANKLYLLLMDTLQEARVTDRHRVEMRFIPYRAEVKQLVNQIEALAIQRQQQETP